MYFGKILCQTCLPLKITTNATFRNTSQLYKCMFFSLEFRKIIVEYFNGKRINYSTVIIVK